MPLVARYRSVSFRVNGGQMQVTRHSGMEATLVGDNLVFLIHEVADPRGDKHDVPLCDMAQPFQKFIAWADTNMDFPESIQGISSMDTIRLRSAGRDDRYSSKGIKASSVA